MVVAPLMASQGRAGNIESPMIADRAAPTLTARGNRYNADEDPFVVVPLARAAFMGTKPNATGIGNAGDPAATLTSRPEVAIAFHAIGSAPGGSGVSPTLTRSRGGSAGVMSFDEQQITHPENRAKVEPDAPAPTLATASRVDVAGAGLAPRRLTPREWERLQGFPDDWTLIETGPAKRNRAAPLAKDTARYKAIGNSMAVPVMLWIGSRIEIVDAIGDDEP